MRPFLIVLSLLLLPCTAFAFEGLLPPPDLKPDQYVYTVPADWLPTGVSPENLKTLNGKLKELHYPFYVVFAKELLPLNGEQQIDAEDLGFSGDRDAVRVRFATSVLADDWANQPRRPFNPVTDTVLVWSDKPRTYAWRPGEDRRKRLSLNEGNLRSFEISLAQTLKNSPPDISGGIFALAQQFDQHVFNVTDPERVAQLTERLRLEEEAAEEFSFLGWVFLGVMLLLLLGVWVWLVRVRMLKAQAAFQGALAKWRRMTANALQSLTKLSQEREARMSLEEATGETKALYDKVMLAANEASLTVRAMEQHIDVCAHLAAQAHFLNHQPLHDALHRLEEPFDFFSGGEPAVVHIKPRDFAHRTKVQLAEARKGWRRIKDALAQCAAEEKDSAPEIDRLVEQADLNGIPHRWLNDHPFFGGEVVGLIEHDPIVLARVRRVLRTWDNSIEGRLREVAEAVSLVKSANLDTIEIPNLKVNPESDPKINLIQAQQASDIFASLLAAAKDLDPNPLMETATEIHQLAKQVRDQTEVLLKAEQHVAGDLLNTMALVMAMREANLLTATDTVKKAAMRFQRIAPAESGLQAGAAFQERAESLMQRAKELLKDGWHLEARKCASEAVVNTQRCGGHIQAALAHCDRLEAEERTFHERVADLDRVRQRFIDKMQEYTGHIRRLPDTRVPVVKKGVQDFAALCAQLDQQEAKWQSLALRARREYLSEQHVLVEEETYVRTT